jgi:hypothetical protein
LIAAAAGLDVIVYGNLWGPPLGAILYALGAGVLGYMALSFLVGGIGAVPGCEMRAIPYLLAQRSGRESGVQH